MRERQTNEAVGQKGEEPASLGYPEVVFKALTGHDGEKGVEDVGSSGVVVLEKIVSHFKHEWSRALR